MKEILSVRTPIGIMTPDRMPMGHVDSALYFQAMVEMILGDLVGECCAVWIDDILLYGRTMDEYIVNLTKMLDKLESAGFKLSFKKSEPVKNEVKWCGRIIDKQGVRHDPARIQALTDLSYPEPSGDHQISYDFSAIPCYHWWKPG